MHHSIPLNKLYDLQVLLLWIHYYLRKNKTIIKNEKTSYDAIWRTLQKLCKELGDFLGIAFLEVSNNVILKIIPDNEFLPFGIDSDDVMCWVYLKANVNKYEA